ncbi:PTS sugar transporter subunit IIA [Liquorilactobacillus hordei]|uniref:PTS sugar transporter subunit IIA n=1 Tax=Liquorilactobacillus hordei TaxID=468911 RepID=UPI0039ED06A6
MFFDKKIIFLKQNVKDHNEALAKLADALFAAGSVKASYKEGILTREKGFPTGLQLPGYGVAIPHTDAERVNSAQIGFMQLEHPITFHQMGDNQEVQVKLIFMLALNEPKKQPEMLQKLMKMFQDTTVMEQLMEQEKQDDIILILEKEDIK